MGPKIESVPSSELNLPHFVLLWAFFLFAPLWDICEACPLLREDLKNKKEVNEITRFVLGTCPEAFNVFSWLCAWM